MPHPRARTSCDPGRLKPPRCEPRQRACAYLMTKVLGFLQQIDATATESDIDAALDFGVCSHASSDCRLFLHVFVLPSESSGKIEGAAVPPRFWVC